MTKSQQTAMVAIVSGLVGEAALCLAFNRWPPVGFSLGAGLGSALMILFYGKSADKLPVWAGLTFTVPAVLVGAYMLLHGYGGCPLPPR